MATNRYGREIWFQRMLWNYWPCHWKGWLIQFLMVCAALLMMGLWAIVCGMFGRPVWDPFVFPVVVILILIISGIISQRHRPD